VLKALFVTDSYDSMIHGVVGRWFLVVRIQYEFVHIVCCAPVSYNDVFVGYVIKFLILFYYSAYHLLLFDIF